LNGPSVITRRFGLCYVNYETQERIPKFSARFFADVIQRNSVWRFPFCKTGPFIAEIRMPMEAWGADDGLIVILRGEVGTRAVLGANRRPSMSRSPGRCVLQLIGVSQP